MDIDPRMYIMAVKLARDHNITPDDLHAYFPHLADSQCDDGTVVEVVQGQLLSIPEEYYEEMDANKIGFR